MRIALILLSRCWSSPRGSTSRREENENRLALVASEVALRDVEVSCPGFWTRLVEITPNAGWVDFDEHGRPGRQDEPLGGDLLGPRAGLAGRAALVHAACSAAAATRRRCARHAASSRWRTSRGTCAASSTRRETQCYAIQSVEAVARRLGVAPSDARLDRAPGRARRRRHAARRVPLRRVPSRRRVRPAPRHARLAERLTASRAGRRRTAARRRGTASGGCRRRRSCPRRGPGGRAA